MILPEPSLKMMDKDDEGWHHVWYRYGKCEHPCSSFNPSTKENRQCEYFLRQPNGVKSCRKVHGK